MERLITDIGQYGTMIEQATAALDEPIDTNTEYRDRQRQMYTDYQAAWDSQGRDSHRAFLRMINDPDQRAEFEADVAAVADALPALDPALRPDMPSIPKAEEAARVGTLVAERARAAGVTAVVFDRGGYLYHGRVQRLADAARAAGLEF